MTKNDTTTKLTMDDAQALIARDGSQTDFATPTHYEAVEAILTSDPDSAAPEDWRDHIIPGLPDIGKENKKLVSVRYSPRVIDYFKSTGKGWQTRMDAVLLSYVDQQQRSQP